MNTIHICGNFAKEGECGTCKHMLLAGCVTGVCEANEYEDCITTNKCICGKYEEGQPQD
ncbi:hypothetical protein U729_3101 (plasmid) [Clostridium baratii str. Sullivan]|uniref:DUF1540 domain-containing protein n=1 Tax=Clostridium baratii str. Sullivan TaxID=1415775 RepID=A0A0A7G2R7_9CLOT|nr:hypothetical protein [Clostridium baratii]AIY85305.1 hypothetical protein U729_3101 [Clostridium baratii str. Sullivan]